MKRIIYYKTALAMAILLSLNVSAQQKDSLLKDNVIDVVKTFQPILSEAIKIPIQPNPEKPEVNPVNFTYQLPQANFQLPPTLYTIKPLALGTMLLPKLKNNYARVGFGNYTMPMGEIYLGSVRNKNNQFGFFAKHLSASGDQAYNNFSNNTAYGYLKHFVNKGVISADAYYHRNVVFLYGSPNENGNLINEPKLIYNLYDLKGAYQSIQNDSGKLNTMVGMNYYHFNQPGSFNENDFQVKSKISKTKTEIPFELEAALRVNNNSINLPNQTDPLSYRRIFFDFNPQLFMNGTNFYLKGGFNSTVVSDTSSANAYVFPKAEGGFHLIPGKVTVLAGITGNLQANTFRSIASENPFATQIGLQNTINRFEIYGGFKGEITPQLAFFLTSSSAAIRNMLFFVHDSSMGNQITTYENSKSRLITLKAGLNYQWAEKWRTGIAIGVFNYELEQLKHAYGRPEFELKWNTTYNIGEKFMLKLDIFHWGERWGRSESLTSGNGYDFKMDAFTDLNFGIDYRYSKSLSAFIQFNNIANNRYQRYYAYPVYGFNLLGGFTFTF